MYFTGYKVQLSDFSYVNKLISESNAKFLNLLRFIYSRHSKLGIRLYKLSDMSPRPHLYRDGMLADHRFVKIYSRSGLEGTLHFLR